MTVSNKGRTYWWSSKRGICILDSGRQQGLGLAGTDGDGQTLIALPQARGPARPPRPHAPSEAELAAHAAFVAKLKDPLWLKDT